MKRKEKPFVSVVIPVLNAEQYIDEVLTALERQTYNADFFETILVDNESTDETIPLAKEYDVELLINSRSKNPYISRNMGVKKAKGEIIAFLDVTCIPIPTWMEEGVKLIQKGADLVGGHIKFKYSSPPSIGEWYDSITFVNVKQYIEEENAAAGGNIFLSRKVWEFTGSFPEDRRSGADILWTKKATSMGYKLVFGEHVTVYYPARKLKGVLRKSFRVGIGHPKIWIEENLEFHRVAWRIVEGFLPPDSDKLQQRIRQRGQKVLEGKFILLWCIEYMSNTTRSFGRLLGLLKVYSDRLLSF
ncbi:MAG TPA: glycosyltransferase [Balneolaceae bacterium]